MAPAPAPSSVSDVSDTEASTGRGTLLLLLFLGLGAIAASIGAISIQASHGHSIVKHMIWHPPLNGSHPLPHAHAEDGAQGSAAQAIPYISSATAPVNLDIGVEDAGSSSSSAIHPPPSLHRSLTSRLKAMGKDRGPFGRGASRKKSRRKAMEVANSSSGVPDSHGPSSPHRPRHLGQHHSPLLGLCESLISKLDVDKVDALRDEMQVRAGLNLIINPKPPPSSSNHRPLS